MSSTGIGHIDGHVGVVVMRSDVINGRDHPGTFCKDIDFEESERDI